MNKEIIDCCFNLESPKMKLRSQGCDQLADLLRKPATIETINRAEDRGCWNRILASMQSCLAKDHEKRLQDCAKKGNMTVGVPIPKSIDVFTNFLRVTCREMPDAIKIQRILNYVLETITDIRKSYFLNAFIKIIPNSFLSNSRIRAQFTPNDWEKLYLSIKNLYERNTVEGEEINCLKAIIKWGPLYNFPVELLREEFDFLTTLSQKILTSAPKHQQEAALDLLLDFCKHTAKDSRMSCCKFGEMVFQSVFDVYSSNPNENVLKSKIIEFFLFQIKIHNPNDLDNNHSTAYAFSWLSWKNSVYKIYNLLTHEIEKNEGMTIKNQALFVVNKDVTKLCDNFVLLYVKVCKQLFNNVNVECPEGEERPAKRLKIFFDIGSLITKIKNTTRSWEWINLMHSLISQYPDMLNFEHQMTLLNCLNDFQVENKDLNITYHTYKTLLTLEVSYNNYLKINEFRQIWKKIAENALRSFNSNTEVQLLIQRLIFKKVITPDAVLQNYCLGGALIPNKNTLKTLDVALQNSNFLKFDVKFKTDIMKWIVSDLCNLAEAYTAEVIVSLTFKQWPLLFAKPTEVLVDLPDDIEKAYLQVSFDELLVSRQSLQETTNEQTFCSDKKVYFIFVDILTKLVKLEDINNENVIYFTSFLFNVLSYLDTCVVEENGFLSQLFNICVDKLFANNFQLENPEENIEKYLELMRLMKKLYCSNISNLMASKLRDSTSEVFLKSMFTILTSDVENKYQDLFDLKKYIIKIIINYTCGNFSEPMAPMQEKALEAVLNSEFDCTNQLDFELVLTALETVTTIKYTFFSDDIFVSFFNLFQKMCEARYHCYFSTIKILNLFYAFFPMVAKAQSLEIKRQFALLLEIFYKKKSDYGPGLLVLLLNCMGLMVEYDLDCSYSTWSNEEIVLKIPEFLRSDYQDVRFAAIINIAKFFEISTKSRQLKHFHLQELMFPKLYEMNLNLLQIKGSLKRNRLIDETVTRTSSIFHTYISVMIASHLWVEEALFAVLEIACKQKLELKMLEQAFEKTSDLLKFENGLQLIETFIWGVVYRWKVYNMDTFPFKLFHCDTKIEFYGKYWNVLAPIAVALDELEHIALNLKLDKEELILSAFPQLLTYCLVEEINCLDNLDQNKVFQITRDTLGLEKLQNLLNIHIDYIIHNLTEFITDENHFKKSFGKQFILPRFKQPPLDTFQFFNCITFLEGSLFEDVNLFFYLSENHPSKISTILLHLKLRISKATFLEDKVRWMHIYSLVALMCVDSIIEESKIQTYLVYELTHTFFNWINQYKTVPILVHVTCKMFIEFLKKITPKLAHIIKKLFLVIASRFKKLALDSSQLSTLCIEMLEFLMIQHQHQFIEEIQKLDSIPETEVFQKLSTVHRNIKYKNREVTLQDEIIQFLELGKTVGSVGSLKHLRELLEQSKDDLRTYFTKLRQTRGFIEDCRDSHLHKLICILITLAKSKNNDVSTEAMRCLGEIGPANLATLVLQPENIILNSDKSPLELFLGVAVSFFSKYLIDYNVFVQQVAGQALVHIFKTHVGPTLLNLDFGFGSIDPLFLNPFFSMSSKKMFLKVTIDTKKFVTNVNNEKLWNPSHNSHDKWIIDLVCAILDTFEEKELFESLVEVCKLKVEFCEVIFPLLVYLILFMDVKLLTNTISINIQTFFSNHWKITVLKQTLPDVGNVCTDKSSIRCMLNVVHFIRLQKNARNKKIKDLELNDLEMAKAAHYCTRYFTAILYAEQWCQIQNLDSGYVSSIAYTKLDVIYEKIDKTTGDALYNILREAYKAVGEIDALLGCGTSQLLNKKSRINHYKEISRWDLVCHSYEQELSISSSETFPAFIDSLNHLNLYHVSLFCSKFQNTPNYESLWRLSQWDPKYSFTNETTNDENFEQYRFFALKALHDCDEFTFKDSIQKGRLSIVKRLDRITLESSKNAFEMLSQMQSLKELEDWAEIKDAQHLETIISKWKSQDDIIDGSYQYMEAIQAQRIVLWLDHIQKHPQTGQDSIFTEILNFSQQARLAEQYHIASRTLQSLSQLPNIPTEISSKIQLEQAKVFWGLKDVITAKCILKQLCSNEDVTPRLHAMALKLTGEWMVESSSESLQNIIENYFQKSLDLLKKNQTHAENEKIILDTYDQLAKFADRQYQQVMSHIKSAVFQKKKENMKKADEAVSSVDVKRMTKDLKKAVEIKKRLRCIDENEIINIETEKNNLLLFALKNYLLNLLKSDNHNITIFRLFSLILENRSNEVIQSVLEKNLLKIPTYKFITVLPQIIPHISGTDDLFCDTITKLIEKCAKDHPYHTIPLILALALSNKDRQYAESKSIVNEGRMHSARNILASLRKDIRLKELIAKMENLSEALIELAYHKQDSDGRSVRILKHLKINKIQSYDDVLLPTYNLYIDKTCNYANIVGISGFGSEYNDVGGINAPKRLTCRGTDGVLRLQLIKGQDDLRQDAVMQQVFTIMNNLLSVNKHTRNLLIRTYKIVPLSMRSGVLEWVDNSMPIGDYLTGENSKNGAHERFRPLDKSPHFCRAEFKQAANKTHEQKLRIFTKICRNIRPVFHKFFEEMFPQPTLWYEKRRAYVHSVATSSMCGYVLGIGDRHVNNILIDKKTAEVIHIDFGIAFEQGRVLPTPETVPFRLTRDIIDGMGVSGVEGVFRKACERTVELLRLHHQTIVTILEVLLYDPLYDWTVSTSEANKRQKYENDEDMNMTVLANGGDDQSEDVNVTAERALLRLRAKLQGTENGRPTTVESQVGMLIQEAVDPANLCRLFAGWQPYL